MSGKQLVQQLRDGSLQPAKPPGSGTGLFALLLVGTFVVGCGAVFGAKLLVPGGTPQMLAAPEREAVEMAAIDLTDSIWTEADDAACFEAAARAGEAERAALDAEQEISPKLMPASSAGMAEEAALVLCHATTKPGRLCDPEQRQAFAMLVERYAKRLDGVASLFNSSVASLNSPLLQLQTGGMPHPGTNILVEGMNDSAERIKVVHRDVTLTVRDLVGAGLIGAEDFDLFLGYGVPETIAAMLGDARVTAPVCA